MEAEFTVDDLRSFKLMQLISEAETKTTSSYQQIFLNKAKKFEESGDKKSQTICELIAVCCSFSLRLDLTNEPYQPQWIWGNGRSHIPSDLSEVYIQILLEVVEELEDAEFRARIADVLWTLRKGSYHIAGVAIDAYLESATILESPEEWSDSAVRIERAQQLSAQLDRNGQSYAKAIAHVENVLGRLNGEDPLWFSHRLMSLLLEQRQGDATKYSALAEKLALAAETSHFWRRARDHWELKAKWHLKQLDEEQAHDAKLRAAETYIREAEDFVSAPKPNYRAASRELMLAVEALRRVGGSRDYIQQIHARLLAYQEKDDDFQTSSFSVDLRKYVDAAREAVEGKTLREAIFTLASLVPIPQMDQLRKEVLGQDKHTPLYLHFSAQQLNEKGRVVAIRPSVISDDKSSMEGALRAEMRRHAGFHHEICAQGLVLPAVNQIYIEHHIHIDDVIEFVNNNPFVPPGHESIYARGLYYGLMGDFMLAAHLLLPQIENSIRFLLNQRDVITTKLHSQGIQDEHNLGTLLYYPELEAICDANLIFDLQGLLIDPFGSNLRNRFAHGMIPTQDFSSLRIVYFWWLVLYICCHPVLAQMLRERPRATSD